MKDEALIALREPGTQADHPDFAVIGWLGDLKCNGGSVCAVEWEQQVGFEEIEPYLEGLDRGIYVWQGEIKYGCNCYEKPCDCGPEFDGAIYLASIADLLRFGYRLEPGA